MSTYIAFETPLSSLHEAAAVCRCATKPSNVVDVHKEVGGYYPGTVVFPKSNILRISGL